MAKRIETVKVDDGKGGYIICNKGDEHKYEVFKEEVKKPSTKKGKKKNTNKTVNKD